MLSILFSSTPANASSKAINRGASFLALANFAATAENKEISIFNQNDEFYDRAKLNVKNINEKTNCKASLFRLEDHEALEKEIKESVLFVNATNVGMHPLENQMILPDTHYLRKDLIVSDVIYSPEETLLLKEAKKLGCKTINGIGMMIYQGAEAFKLWTGMEMPIDTVKDALNLK